MKKMNFKSFNNTIQGALFCLLFFTMICMTGLLIVEYFFFKQQALRMLELQKDYQEYIQEFKQSLYTSQKKKETYENFEECQEDEMNGVYGLRNSCLNLVNREVLYLRECALDFGKAHNLEKVIKPLYDGGNWDTNYAQIINQRLSSNGSTFQSRKPRIAQEKVHFYPVDFVLSWPINRTQFWISSNFGPRKNGFHYGIDLAALKGTPVYAALDGVVIEASYTPHGYGKSIVIDHKKCKTRYAHLNDIYVKVGQKVTTTKPIGAVGKTGLVKGKKPEHLHFEVIDLFGKRINPMYILK
jgi:murein DD-endopeptidase MepM/ murein hydrolase activator NlpD